MICIQWLGISSKWRTRKPELRGHVPATRRLSVTWDAEKEQICRELQGSRSPNAGDWATFRFHELRCQAP